MESCYVEPISIESLPSHVASPELQEAIKVYCDSASYWFHLKNQDMLHPSAWDFVKRMQEYVPERLLRQFEIFDARFIGVSNQRKEFGHCGMLWLKGLSDERPDERQNSWVPSNDTITQLPDGTTFVNVRGYIGDRPYSKFAYL